MEINKALWASEGDNVRLSMPLTKVDQEKRLVSGWASLDNTDTQKDVVLAEASKKAFSRFRGNIREMHQPVAVGKMVEFKEDQYYDEKAKKFYNGIYATVYVSKGAPDTWEKVLDGTLTGFSIGGSIVDAETVVMKDSDGPVRIVKDYELVELSLVDSPANQLANIFSIEKAADGTKTMYGMVAETRTETVYYCKNDGVAKTSNDETVDCGNCGKNMVNIGWFEYGSDTEKTMKMAELVEGYHSSHTDSGEAKQELPATNKGGVDVAEEKKDEVTVEPGSAAPAEVGAAEQGKAENEVTSSVDENVEKASAVEEVASEEVVAEEEAPKAADVPEVEVEEPDFAKMIGDLQGAINSALEKNLQASTDAVEKAVATVDSKISELAAKHDELTTKFDGLKTELESVEKSLRAVESDTAVKKSGDLGGSTGETLKKSKTSTGWGGVFLGTTLDSE